MGSGKLPDPFVGTQPVYQAEAVRLMAKLQKLSVKRLQQIMHLSPKLAATTHQRICDWQESKAHPAIMAFQGDVYKGFLAKERSNEALRFAQEHVRILSGLYGILRPFDVIQHYRLEMNYKPSVSLYDFWGDKIAKELPGGEIIINLLSEEYFKVIRPYVADRKVIAPQFLRYKNGVPEFQAVHAKIARGAYAAWASENAVSSVAELGNFDWLGYSYVPSLSTPDKPTFVA